LAECNRIRVEFRNRRWFDDGHRDDVLNFEREHALSPVVVDLPALLLRAASRAVATGVLRRLVQMIGHAAMSASESSRLERSGCPARTRKWPCHGESGCVARPVDRGELVPLSVVDPRISVTFANIRLKARTLPPIADELIREVIAADRAALDVARKLAGGRLKPVPAHSTAARPIKRRREAAVAAAR
jgi:hypothetical protein